jgi:Integrase core domain
MAVAKIPSPEKTNVSTECSSSTRRQLESVLSTFVEHYDVHRPHRSLGLIPPLRAKLGPTTATGGDTLVPAAARTGVL